MIELIASNAGVVGIIVEQVEEVQMCPHVVADCNDLVNHDACPRPLTGNFGEEPAQRDRAVRNQRVVLDVGWADELRGSLFGSLLIDHQIIQSKNIVLVAHSAAVVGSDQFDHGGLLHLDGFQLYSRPTI